MQLRNKFISIAALITCGAFTYAQAPPQLDELNDTKLKLVLKSMEAAQLQQSIAAQNVQKSREDMQQLVISLEAKYPGYTLNIQSGTLMPKPTQSSATNPTRDPHTGNTLPDATPLKK